MGLTWPEAAKWFFTALKMLDVFLGFSYSTLLSASEVSSSNWSKRLSVSVASKTVILRGKISKYYFLWYIFFVYIFHVFFIKTVRTLKPDCMDFLPLNCIKIFWCGSNKLFIKGTLFIKFNLGCVLMKKYASFFFFFWFAKIKMFL